MMTGSIRYSIGDKPYLSSWTRSKKDKMLILGGRELQSEKTNESDDPEFHFHAENWQLPGHPPEEQSLRLFLRFTVHLEQLG